MFSCSWCETRIWMCDCDLPTTQPTYLIGEGARVVSSHLDVYNEVFLFHFSKSEIERTFISMFTSGKEWMIFSCLSLLTCWCCWWCFCSQCCWWCWWSICGQCCWYKCWWWICVQCCCCCCIGAFNLINSGKMTVQGTMVRSEVCNSLWCTIATFLDFHASMCIVCKIYIVNI